MGNFKNRNCIYNLAWIVLLGFPLASLSQNLSQILRGRVLDADSKSPIFLANVLLTDSHPPKGTSTDETGYFQLDSVPLGRISIQVSYVGYESKTIDNILMISGKESFLQIELRERANPLEEIVITDREFKSEAINDMALTSVHLLSVEESNRFAAGIGDPARLVSAFAGVNTLGTGRNEIIVRGNNPRFVQWRLEGVEIPNPNHFSTEGLTGGPINALNSQMLSNSDFFTGAFPPSYGNALGGIFDMKMRNGNYTNYEFTFNFSALGTDLTAEGPLPFENSGFLINYRYSTLSLLDKLNIVNFGGVPNYQDLSFKFLLAGNPKSSLTLFGLGGKSNIDISFSDENNMEEIIQKSDERSRLGIIGIKYLRRFTENSYINTTFSINSNGSKNRLFKKDTFPKLIKHESTQLDNVALRIAPTYHLKINSQNSIEAGITFTKYNLNFSSDYFDKQLDRYRVNQNYSGSASLLQFFSGWKWRFSENWTMVNGLHFQKSSQNPEITIEPRSSIRFAPNKKHSFHMGIGYHSQMTSLSNYFAVLDDTPGQEIYPNSNLKFIKAQHMVLGYENRLSDMLIFKLETYYQRLYDVPIEIGETSYSVINQTFDFINKRLVNDGEGRNIGVDLTLEKYFSGHHYYLITASLFDSKYVAGGGIWRNTRFNGNYVFNALYGREFEFKRKNILSVNVRGNLSGGRRLKKIDLVASVESGRTVYYNQDPFREKGDDIFSLSLSAGYRINSKKVSHEIKIDVQNLTNNKAVIDYAYIDRNREIEEVHQLSIFPVFAYVLYF